MIRAIVAAAALLLLATACSKVTYVTPEAATEQARGGGATSTVGPPTAITDATPEPTDEPDGRIRPGVWVRVAAAGDCLNFRAHPSPDERVAINYCRPDGFEGYVAAGPEENDDGRWWFIAGLGWAIDDFLVFDRVEDLSERVVPELEGLGRIVFAGPNGDLWAMNSDGSERRRVVDVDPSPAFGVFGPQWSPDGQTILYGSSRDGRLSVHIADLFGNDVYVFDDAALASWSPAGDRVALLYDVERVELGSIFGTPSVVDLATGAVVATGPAMLYNQGPTWRPNGREVAYDTPEGVVLARADGSDARELGAVGRVPNWPGEGDRVSLSAVGDDCRGYIVFNVERNEVELCAPAPPSDQRRGGRDGTAEDRQTDWSPNGRYFAYHTEWAAQNRSGVYVVDVEGGDQTLVPGWQAAFTSFASDSKYIVFGTSGVGTGEFIWVGDIETGEVILLAEGSAPAFTAER